MSTDRGTEVVIEGLGTLRLEQKHADFRVLLVDDNENFVGLLAEEFRALPNLKVETASGIDEAERILKTDQVDAVIADVVLDDQIPSKSRKGDDWIMSLGGRTGLQFRALLTGYLDEVKNQRLLEAAGVSVIQKSSDEEDALPERIRNIAELAAQRQLAERLLEAGSALRDEGKRQSRDAAREQLVDVSRQLFLRWVSANSGSSAGIFVGGRGYDLDGLRHEVEADSEVGRLICRMYAEDVLGGG